MPKPSPNTHPTPPSLRELQQRFCAAVLANPSDQHALAPFSVLIRSNGLAPAERIDVYRNNTLVGLSKALSAVYPVIERLVGNDFFRYASHQFIHAYPSRSGDLAHFGHKFADFLADFPPATDLPYLPDVARLELACHRAYSAPDAAPLALDSLAQIPPEHFEALRFRLHPSTALLESSYPISRIWQVNQPDFSADPTVDLDLSGDRCTLLVSRPLFEVDVTPLTAGAYALLRALANGDEFNSACAQALVAQADYDITVGLQQFVTGHVLVDFYF